MEINLQTAVVYLVDDDPSILDSLSVLIKSTGLNIKNFASAENFLDSYSPEQPGCLILDVRMPVMGGLELQEELAKRQIQVPIIFISGNAEIPDTAKAFRAGAVDFLEKPFDSHLLIERINEAIAKDNEARRQQVEKNKIQACFDCLTAREKEVLQLIISSHNNKETAKKLAISHRTVDAHRARIMEKMQAEDITELVAIALRHSLFSESESAKDKSH